MCHPSHIFILLLSILQTEVGRVTGADSKFRILAPQFICPKDANDAVEKPDNTVITLQVQPEADIRIEWRVRWSELSPAPTQRFTLQLWKTVRELEKQLNESPPEPYVYVIDNSQLLPGVNYTFTVTSIESNGEVSEAKNFFIDNTQGDQKLVFDGRSDMLSVLLIAPQMTYADAGFIVEAEVTTCQHTQEYYFLWSVRSLGSHDWVDVTSEQGSRLEVPACALKPGFMYIVTCEVIRYNTGDLITVTSVPFYVEYKGLEVFLSVDHIIVPIDTPFNVEVLVFSHDYCDTVVILFEWECTSKEESCNASMAADDAFLSFPSGLPDVGEYNLKVTVKVINQTASANATVVVIKPKLPTLELAPLSRILNEGSMVEVLANATNLPPNCKLSWYFADEDYLTYSGYLSSNESGGESQHGEALSDTLAVNSLEEQFLNELVDFSNETEWRQVSGLFPATAGRARVVARCECSLAFSCRTLGEVHADLWFHLNSKPRPKDVLVSPETGTALETIFRISTLAASDPDTPLLYSFYCSVGNETILLSSLVEHRATKTLLPYNVAGVKIWVKVCDALGACAKSRARWVAIEPGEGRTLDSLIVDVGAHARRCEFMKLAKVLQSAIITYTNTRNSGARTRIYHTMEKLQLKMNQNNCVAKYYSHYSELLIWLANHDAGYAYTKHLRY